MTTNKVMKAWKASLPVGKPFRVSVLVRKGSRFAYTYVNCLNISQLENWLKKNEAKIVDVVNVA